MAKCYEYSAYVFDSNKYGILGTAIIALMIQRYINKLSEKAEKQKTPLHKVVCNKSQTEATSQVKPTVIFSDNKPQEAAKY